MQIDPEEYEKAIIKQRVPLKNMRVLEIGCGRGRLSSILAEGALSLTGIDLDEKALKEAEKNADGKFMLAAAESLPFADGVFEHVVFSLSLHETKADKALEEAKRVLTPGGNITIIDPSSDSPVQKMFNLFEDEAALIKNAREAICSLDGIVPVLQTVYTVPWIFSDNNEIEEFFSKEYPDASSNTIRQLKDIYMMSAQPYKDHISIADIMDLFILRKR